MSSITDRLERDLREVATGAHPSPAAWESIVARLGDDAWPEVAPSLMPVRTSARPGWLAVAAAALAVLIGSAALVARGGDQAVTTASDLTATFVSPRNGFSVRHPDGAAVTPAEQLWGFGEQVDDGFDVIEIGPASVFTGTSREFPGDFPCLDDASQVVPCGSTDERVDRELSEGLPGWCGVPRHQQEEIIVDGQPGRLAECAGHIEVTVIHGGRLYLFTLVHDGADARDVLDAVAATIDLTPETGVDFLGLTETFASPTYGLSFGYVRGLAPATEIWDPTNQPARERGLDPRFDAVETGYGAYLEVASTEVPEGVSIDGWVDEFSTPVAAGGCGVPRAQQEEVTIDGHAGRVAECRDRVESTVVAGGRLYLFVVYRDSRDARALFEAWMDTIDLTPETATAPG